MDERAVVKPMPQMEIFGNEHDFGENEAVDKGEAVMRKIDLMLRQDDSLIELE
jgi:hypothetical protein